MICSIGGSVFMTEGRYWSVIITDNFLCNHRNWVWSKSDWAVCRFSVSASDCQPMEKVQASDCWWSVNGGWTVFWQTWNCCKVVSIFVWIIIDLIKNNVIAHTSLWMSNWCDLVVEKNHIISKLNFTEWLERVMSRLEASSLYYAEIFCNSLQSPKARRRGSLLSR